MRAFNIDDYEVITMNIDEEYNKTIYYLFLTKKNPRDFLQIKFNSKEELEDEFNKIVKECPEKCRKLNGGIICETYGEEK